MNRFFVNVLILGCIVGIVFAMPASAQVSYFLKWDGLFDIEADWASPHSSHRKGDQTDLRYSNLTAAERTVLEEKILNMGGQILIHGVDSNKHYHVDWSGRR